MLNTLNFMKMINLNSDNLLQFSLRFYYYYLILWIFVFLSLPSHSQRHHHCLKPYSRSRFFGQLLPIIITISGQPAVTTRHYHQRSQWVSHSVTIIHHLYFARTTSKASPKHQHDHLCLGISARTRWTSPIPLPSSSFS